MRGARIRHFPQEICTRRTSIQNIQTHIQKARTTEIHHKTDPFPSLPYTVVVMPSRPKRCSSNTRVPSTRMKPKTTILLLDAAAIQRQQRGAGRISSDEKTNITAVKNHALSRAVNPHNSSYKNYHQKLNIAEYHLETGVSGEATLSMRM